MSGESEDEDANEWQWAHLLWQRRGLRMEEFATMDRNIQLAYIASETLELDQPANASDRIAKALLRKK